MRGERDSRGFLVTHVVFREDDGTPVLKLVDMAKADSCMAERRCQTCGLGIPVGDWVGFIGPPGADRYKEAPIHLECAFYSFTVCPHLLAGSRADNIRVAVCREYRHLPRADEDVRAGRPSVCVPAPVTAPADVADVEHRAPGARDEDGVVVLSPAEVITWVTATR
jgi:hypothetical protein